MGNTTGKNLTNLDAVENKELDLVHGTLFCGSKHCVKVFSKVLSKTMIEVYNKMIKKYGNSEIDRIILDCILSSFVMFSSDSKDEESEPIISIYTLIRPVRNCVYEKIKKRKDIEVDEKELTSRITDLYIEFLKNVSSWKSMRVYIKTTKFWNFLLKGLNDVTNDSFVASLHFRVMLIRILADFFGRKFPSTRVIEPLVSGIARARDIILVLWLIRKFLLPILVLIFFVLLSVRSGVSAAVRFLKKKFNKVSEMIKYVRSVILQEELLKYSKKILSSIR